MLSHWPMVPISYDFFDGVFLNYHLLGQTVKFVTAPSMLPNWEIRETEATKIPPKRMKSSSSSWWLNLPTHLKKYARQIGSFPQIGMNINKYLKPPPSHVLLRRKHEKTHPKPMA